MIQGFLLLGGALLVCILGVTYIKGGFSTVFQDISTHQKVLSGADFNVHDLSKFVPLILAGQIFNSLYQYTGSKMWSNAIKPPAP
ncbi:predicted sialic acid transporter [Agrilactobacillus composti DSM 18527 = JCM 14202]|nr:predicted sialic acid transporter [Agrilactobacillus composti DSM 18527 = JCM 14202]